MIYYVVRTENRPRLETLYLEEARSYAQKIYDEDGVIPEIEERDGK